MENSLLNDYSKTFIKNFDFKLDLIKKDLSSKINRDLNDFKHEILKSSIVILEELNKNNSKQAEIRSNDKDRNKNQGNFYIINIGGKTFKIKYKTLFKYPNCKLAEVINLKNSSKISDEHLDDEGIIYFDRNPKYFDYILDSIRYGFFIETSDYHFNEYILEELKYFKLENLINNDKNNKNSKISEIKTNLPPKTDIYFEYKRDEDQFEQNIDNNKCSSNKKFNQTINRQKCENKKINFSDKITEKNEDESNLKTNENNQFEIDDSNQKNHIIVITKNFEFDNNYKNPNLKLLNENKTVENIVGWEDATVLGNIEMTEGKYKWEIYIDELAYDNWITIGVAEKNEISKNMKDEHLNSWSISSTQESWRMDRPLNNLKQKNNYFCFLDFDNNMFRIIGPGIDCKNVESIKGKRLFLIVNVFNSKNKLTVLNYESILEKSI